MKKYQDLQFIDDFMFCKVMTTNPEICKRILTMILGKKVKKIVVQGAQQVQKGFVWMCIWMMKKKRYMI